MRESIEDASVRPSKSHIGFYIVVYGILPKIMQWILVCYILNLHLATADDYDDQS